MPQYKAMGGQKFGKYAVLRSFISDFIEDLDPKKIRHKLKNESIGKSDHLFNRKTVRFWNLLRTK